MSAPDGADAAESNQQTVFHVTGLCRLVAFCPNTRVVSDLWVDSMCSRIVCIPGCEIPR